MAFASAAAEFGMKYVTSGRSRTPLTYVFAALRYPPAFKMEMKYSKPAAVISNTAEIGTATTSFIICIRPPVQTIS